MPLRVDPATAASRWTAGLGSASQKITEGIQRVNQAPGAKAAANRQGYINGVNGAVDKWARNVGRVSLEEWRQAFINKGVPRVAQGAQASQSKFQDRITPVFAYMSNVLATVDQMPNTTPAERDARMLTYVQNMRRYSG
jgi:hypothetical protein